MLSDAERRRLAEIEMSLQADDPAFARQFNVRWRKARRRRIGALCAIPVALAVTIMALAWGSVLVAVVGLCATAAASGLWISSR